MKAKGYSGADVEALCREAAMNALRESIDAKEVTRKDFDKAMETVRPSINPEDGRVLRAVLRTFQKGTGHSACNHIVGECRRTL